MAEENKVGRPLKFESAEELQKQIDAYFDSCFEESWYQGKDGIWHQRVDRLGNPVMYQKRPFTISGLAVALNTTRETLLDYEERDGYSDTVKQAKQRIENYTEEQLFNAEARNMTGIIFNLKNNYRRWVEKQEVDSNIANKDGKPFETKSAVAGLTTEELRALAKSRSTPSD